MADKPSYLGLLNAIALGEGNAHKYLRAWAAKTTDEDVREVIQTVAIREGEHALAFEKRLCELGYGLIQKEDPKAARNMEIACADCSDLEKFEALGYGRQGGRNEDPFGRMFEDKTLDPQTGALLGRYIAEERDSGRRLRACYETLKARANGGSVASDEIAGLRERIDSLSDTLTTLVSEVRKLRD